MWAVWVLLWKHCLVRKRKYLSTLYEYLYPLILLLLIYWICRQSLTQPIVEPVQRKEPLMYDELVREHEGGSVLFTPDTTFTNRLMDEVGARLDLNRLDRLPNTETGYFPFSNDMALAIMKYSKEIMTSEDAIVVFEEMNDERIFLFDVELDMWPERLSYVIHMKTGSTTDEYNPRNTGLFWRFSRDYRENFGMQSEAFMRLQWALDTSYLQLLTGTKVDQTLVLQEFSAADDEAFAKHYFVCAIIGVMQPLGILVMYTHLVDALYDGKNSGMHEIVKMAGVSWEELAVSQVLDLVPHLLIYAVGSALFYKLTGLVPHTGGVYIAAALALHYLSIAALAFAVVYIFNLTQHTTLVSVVIFFGALIASYATLTYWWCSISLPHAAFVQFWFIIGLRERKGADATSIWVRDPLAIISVPECYLFMVLQTLFFAMVAWYFSKVQPGKYGQALPWNFIYIKDYWYMQPKPEATPTSAQLVSEDDQQYFEKAPVGLPVGIKIIDVYKSFGKDAVLHGVNLTVYNGEITVLLGHNGAGKTTLINIITGLISVTSGRVLVEGKDTVKQAREVRKLIGLCTQDNIFFAELTLLQHAMFFAMVKGKTCSQARASATEILTKLHLSDKEHVVPGNLSGGMKRRLQLACAVAGGARVLMLDEPTSGLDVETRRELWDMLLSLRGNRTVLLTTHFMEEADALGDRIVALHHGRVRCNATAMFLKRAIGTGYRLSFTTIGVPQEAAITSAITSVVPEATVREQQPNGITYNLPAKDTTRFPELFAVLEDRRSELRIDTIGVGKSTLDEVFVKLCSDEKLTYMEELDATSTEPRRERVTGFELYARQFAALLLRQWRYITSKIISLIFIVVLIVFLIWLFTVTANNSFGKEDAKKPSTTVGLDLDLYSERPERRVLVNVDQDTWEALRMSFRGVDFETTPDVGEAVLRAAREDDQEYLVGIELNDTNAKALYTTKVRHAAPVAVNALSNALAARMLASSDAEPSMLAEPRKIAARYQPLRSAYVPYQDTELKQPKNAQLIQEWAANVAMLSLFYVMSLMGLPCLERAAGTRHALVMAGAPRVLVWSATYVAHMVQASLICALPVILFAAVVDKDDTFRQLGFLVALCMVLMLGFPAFLGLVYLVSMMAKQGVVSTALIICVVIFVMTPKLPETYKLAYYLKMVVFALMPPHALTVGVQRTGTAARLNAYCNLNRDKCPTLDGPPGFEADKCCGSSPGSEPWCYWSTSGGAGWPLIILGAQTVMYCILTLLVDNGTLGRLRARCSRATLPRAHFADAAVRAEGAYVAKAIRMSKKQIQDAILCHNLQKNFPSCRGKALFAVKGLTFSVKKGECFGLLGVNGAGKSTTFSMLTGQVSPTGGDIFANGHNLSDGVAYMRTFSYCPQFSGVDSFLSGRQNLALLLTLRGLQAADVTTVTAYWIEEVDLSAAADKRVSSYSGGMARRLAAAAALCQAAPTAVLDEPTAGVDPVARRRMHVALIRARHNRSLIVASHSMDEMEAICHRIAIMSGGELRALGTTAALKAQYGKGYSVVFKLLVTTEDAAGDITLQEFKNQVSSRFECELRDEHLGILSYYIKESLRYSELFSHLEQLREQFPALLEDYTVTETTLEEVFLILAKEAREKSGV